MEKLIVLALVLLFCLALMLNVGAEAASGAMRITVLDQASLFDAEDLQYFADLQGTPVRGDVQLLLITSNYALSEGEVAALCGADRGAAVAALLIKPSGNSYYYEMFLFNRADKMLTRAESDAILDNDQVYRNIKGGRLLTGATCFFELCVGEINEWHRQRPLWIVGVGTAVGTLAGGLSVLGVVLTYRRKRHGESYPLDRYAKLELTERSDIFVGSFVTRTRVQSSSGNGSGGLGRGGGGGFGGGFSGGSRGGR